MTNSEYVLLTRLFLKPVLLLVLLYAPLLSATPVVWLSEWDPAKNKAVTIDEQTRDTILQNLTSPAFTIAQTNSQRALRRLKNEKNICVGDRVYNDERAKYALASQLPQVVVPGLRLYISASFLEAHTLSVEKLQNMVLTDVLADYPSLRLGVVSGRSYGDTVDQMLESVDGSEQLWHRSSSDMGEGVIEMLLTERVDATFEYPPLFEKVIDVSPVQPAIKGVILKGMPGYAVGHVLCSRSQEGREAIRAISASLENVTQQRRYLDIHLSALPEPMHQHMVQYYNSVFGTDFVL